MTSSARTPVSRSNGYCDALDVLEFDEAQIDFRVLFEIFRLESGKVVAVKRRVLAMAKRTGYLTRAFAQPDSTWPNQSPEFWSG